MSTRIFNLSTTSAPVPGPNFYWKRDTDGKGSGRHTFTTVRGAMALGSMQARFKKGTPITSLDPTLPAFFNFLKVEEFEAQDLPGGFEEVSVILGGYTEDGEFETDREVSYSSQNSLVEKSMLLNPKFRAAVDKGTRKLFAGMYNALFSWEITTEVEGEPTEVKVFNIRTDDEVGTLSDEDHCKWFRMIFIEDRRTFEAPAFEWRKTSANAGGLADSEIDALGKRDSNPPGDAPHPDSPEGETYIWLKIAANDERGESSASTEEVWQWGDWPTDIYETAGGGEEE